ncbi:TonB-dependent receptor [Olivibacter domesticus]|uniref:TonB-linked outer membrane protein, SusC/RagA family n=1 Tax=Olivibacter domesticus TaxID=407022 RepID=A0A1H7RAU3_OLID1|nr:TonB-dependent receptor [Olivibacter domesticus]SEL57371.1 TonB-linked outer membrane protein, SusC/RagA family [Olivibacter domesticus]
MIFLNRKPLFANSYWHKALMAMKLITTLLFAGLVQVHASVYSQNKFTLTEGNVAVRDVFQKIEKQSKYSIFYRQDQVNLLKKVNVQVENADINLLMRQVLKDQPLSFEVIDDMVVITANQRTQERTITGKVTDEKGAPLVGVTIKVKGGNAGTVTDVDGAFRLKLSRGNETLTVSYTGFAEKEMSAEGKTYVEVTLEESTSSLDEVVVVGYGTVKKRDLTGAVSSVKAEDITLSPVSSPMEALQGRVSGLDIQRGSGKAGTSPAVLLRGNRSLTASQDPLYIVDGIPSSINNLNPNDIESIDVLKDASSTAIYGSAGANGVIIITTKKAKEGRVQLDFNSYYGINGFASFPKPLTGDAWLDYKRDRFFLDNGYEATDLTDLGLNTAAIAAIDQGKWVDWVDETMRNGIQQNHHFAIRGGSEKTQAYLSMGYIGEKGIYENDNTDIYNARGGVDLKFSKVFKAGFQSILNYRKSNSTNSRVNKAYSIYPLGTPYDEQGVVNLFPLEGDANNVSILANNYPGAFADQSRSFNLQFNPYVEFSPIENLSLRSNFGAQLSNGRLGNFQNRNSYNLLSEGRTASEAAYTTNFNYNYIWENIINYHFNLVDDHEFTVTGISSWADNRFEENSLAGNGLDYDEFLFYNMGALQNLTARSNTYRQTKRLSFAGRLNYSFKGKYLLQLTNRWDGVSQLAEGNKWSSFPSASLAWRISDEAFMSNTKTWLNSLKLRGGYGVSGQANIDPYVSLTRTATRTGNLSLGGTTPLPVYTPTENIANAALTWERSANANIGLDISILDNRLDISTEYYHTKTTGILWDRRIPTSFGGYDAKTPYKKTSNIATSKNKGFEFTVNARNIVKNNFQWTTALTFTSASEKLTNIDLGNLSVEDLISEGLFIGETPAAEGVFYDYKKIGIWQLGEEAEAAQYGAAPGDLKLQTVEQFVDGVSDNGVHPYSTKDRMIVGSVVPDFFFGVQNTLRYKNIDLTVFVSGRYGHMMRAQVLGYWNREAQPSTYSYWMPENATNDFPRPGGSFNTQFESALQLVDGSYLKIKNITLGYTLPEKIGRKLGVGNLRIYGTAYNPFIFTRSHLLKNVDPENGGADSFPLYKQIVFGINLSL